ncbi:hypothetical protein LCGC14_2452390, partial [marine sediment metagenome]
MKAPSMAWAVRIVVVATLAAGAGYASAAGKAGEKMFRVDDYGADPTGKKDSGPGIRKAVAAAMAHDGAARVVLSAGTYRLTAAEGANACLPIVNAEDLTVAGVKGKTELIVTDPTKGMFNLRGCRNVAVKSLAIDYDPPPFTQGVLVGVDEKAGTFDLKIDEGFEPPDRPWFSQADRNWGMIFDRTQRRLKTGWVDSLFYDPSCKRLGPRTYRIQAVARQKHRVSAMAVGDRWVHMARRVGEGGLLVWGCKNTLIEDVTVMAAPSCASAIVACEKTVVRRLSVRYRRGTKRLLTTNADGIHCAQNRSGPLIELCYFEGMADDSLNIYCRPSVVLRVDSPTRLMVTGNTTIMPGDTLQVVDPRTGICKGQVKVARAERARRRYWIDLAKPFEGLRAGKDHTDADTLFNLDSSGEGYIIRNNTMRLHRRHGML